MATEIGAHLAGYAGHYLREKGLMLGRITGMDPADPYFENTEPLIRLDPTDGLSFSKRIAEFNK